MRFVATIIAHYFGPQPTITNFILEWIIDRYRVKTDKRSGITNDPNDPDNPRYIVKLIQKVITVSLETVEIVKKLPDLE